MARPRRHAPVGEDGAAVDGVDRASVHSWLYGHGCLVAHRILAWRARSSARACPTASSRSRALSSWRGRRVGAQAEARPSKQQSVRVHSQALHANLSLGGGDPRHQTTKQAELRSTSWHQIHIEVKPEACTTEHRTPRHLTWPCMSCAALRKAVCRRQAALKRRRSRAAAELRSQARSGEERTRQPRKAAWGEGRRVGQRDPAQRSMWGAVATCRTLR